MGEIINTSIIIIIWRASEIQRLIKIIKKVENVSI